MNARAPAPVAPSAASGAELGRRTFAPSFVWDGKPAVKVAFFDADSTLRVSKSGSVSADSPEDVALLPHVADKLAELADQGYLIVIVSNQAGVQYGYVTIETADAALQHTIELIRKKGGDVHYYDFAESKGPDRKPATGMAERLEANLKASFGPEVHIDRDGSFMIGDAAYKKGEPRPDGTPGIDLSNSDRLFAEAFGIEFQEPADYFAWREKGVDRFDKYEDLLAYPASGTT